MGLVSTVHRYDFLTTQLLQFGGRKFFKGIRHACGACQWALTRVEPFGLSIVQIAIIVVDFGCRSFRACANLDAERRIILETASLSIRLSTAEHAVGLTWLQRLDCRGMSRCLWPSTMLWVRLPDAGVVSEEPPLEYLYSLTYREHK